MEYSFWIFFFPPFLFPLSPPVPFPQREVASLRLNGGHLFDFLKTHAPINPCFNKSQRLCFALLFLFLVLKVHALVHIQHDDTRDSDMGRTKNPTRRTLKRSYREVVVSRAGQALNPRFDFFSPCWYGHGFRLIIANRCPAGACESRVASVTFGIQNVVHVTDRCN